MNKGTFDEKLLKKPQTNQNKPKNPTKQTTNKQAKNPHNCLLTEHFYLVEKSLAHI